MDFVGQKGPSSKVYLLVLDMLVLGLQITHMATGMVRKRLKQASNATTPPASGGNPQPVSSQPSAGVQQQQDIESEERGVHRTDYGADIEMQTLNSSGTAANETTSSASEILMATTAPRTDAHIFDAFNSGQIVLADIDLWKHTKEQAHMIKNYRANAENSQLQNRTLRAELAGRLIRMRMGTDALRQSI